MSVLALVLAACGGDAGGDGDGDGVSVVASFYPLAEVASRVAGDRADVENLTPPGAEPHDFELSTDDLDAIEDADLLLYLGDDFQPAIEEVTGRAGRAVDLLGSEERIEGDPHVWLDPRRMTAMARAVHDALVELDPDGAGAYGENAERYVAELEALDADFEDGLADCERDTIVTAHAAFGYLTERYGLRQVAIAGLSPDAEPDPARLADVIDQVRAEGVTTVFSETLVAPDLAETLAREAGIDTAVLDPLEGLDDEQLEDGASYASVMRANLDALRLALGCR